MKEYFIILTNLTLRHFCYYMLFCYFCIYVIIIYNYFFPMELIFFQNEKKIFSTRKINYCVLSRCACAKLKIFLSSAKFLKWTPALKGTCNTSQGRKYQKLWRMDCVKFAQGWKVALLIDFNDIHKNTMLKITSY